MNRVLTPYSPGVWVAAQLDSVPVQMLTPQSREGMAYMLAVVVAAIVVAPNVMVLHFTTWKWALQTSTLQSSPDNATGLSVDAVPVYLSRLPNRTNHHKWNAGLAYRPGMDKVYWLHPDDIAAHKLSDFLKGFNAVGPPHPVAKAELTARGLMNLLCYDYIPVVTFRQLVERFNVTSITTVKIDAELHSLDIASGVAECCLFNNSCCPAEISFKFFDQGRAADMHNYDAKMAQLKRALDKLGYQSLGCQASTGLCTYKAAVAPAR